MEEQDSLKAWRRPWLPVSLVMAALLAPLLVVQMPPLFDYPNHLGRMAILAGQTPALAPYYSISWAVLPNLAMDLVVPWMMGIMPLHLAGRIFAGLALVLPVLGVVAYHRAVFRTWSWWPLGAGLVAYNGLYLMGFVNFHVGMGIAFLVAAAWIRWSAERLPLAMAALLPGALVAVFCHLSAAGLLLLLVGAHELGRLWERRRQGAAAFWAFVGRCVPIGIAFLIVLLVYAQVPAADWGGGGSVWLPWRDKPLQFLVPFAGYHARFDALCAALVLATMLFLVVSGRARLDPGSVIAGAICFMAFVVTPNTAGASVLNSAFLDPRFALYFMLIAFAGLQPRLGRTSSTVVVTGGAVLGAARIAIILVAWQAFDREHRELQQAMAHVPVGARVATATVERAANPAYFLQARERRIISFLWQQPDHHLGALLVAERGAFWPSLFAFAGQQPIVASPSFADFNTSRWYALPDRGVLDPAWRAPADVPASHLAVWQNWPDRFDFILVLNARAAGDARTFLPGALELVDDTGMAALYLVRAHSVPARRPTS